MTNIATQTVNPTNESVTSPSRNRFGPDDDEDDLIYIPELHILDACVFSIVLLIITTQWIYYYRKFGMHVGEKSYRDLIEAILFTVACVLLVTYPICFILRNIFSRNINNALYSTIMLVIYTLLWLRQRPIYTDKAVGHLSNRATRFFSKYFIIYIYVNLLSFVTIIIAVFSTGVCLETCYRNILVSFLVAGPLSIQLPLLALLVYPLYKHHSANQVTNLNLVNLIKRLTVLTTLCVLSDVVSVLIRVYSGIIFIPVNLAVNLLCVALAPRNWQARFMPCLPNMVVKEKSDRQTSRENGSSSGTAQSDV